MSLTRWQKRAKEEVEVERQEETIRQAARKQRLEDKIGSIKAERLLQPVTSRLARAPIDNEPEQVGPDYAMDEFDRINPFGYDDFQPEAVTEKEEKEEEEPLPQQLPTPLNLSNLLVNAKRLIKMNKTDPDYVVKSKKSSFHGFDIADLKNFVKEYGEKRKGPNPEELRSGKRALKRAPLKKATPRPLSNREQAIVARRDAIEGEDKEPSEWMEGSGTAESADKLIHRLYLGLGHIRAGNTSIKLRRQIGNLVNQLLERGVINQFQANKIFF